VGGSERWARGFGGAEGAGTKKEVRGWGERVFGGEKRGRGNGIGDSRFPLKSRGKSNRWHKTERKEWGGGELS